MIAVIHRIPDEREEIELATFSDNLETEGGAQMRQSETLEQTQGDTEHTADGNLDLRDENPVERGIVIEHNPTQNSSVTPQHFAEGNLDLRDENPVERGSVIEDNLTQNGPVALLTIGEENLENLRRSDENEIRVIETIDSDEPEAVAGMCSENRNFLKVKLGNTEYKALYDPGATISPINADIADKFKNRIEKNETIVESAMGTAYKCLGKLKINLVVDGVLRNLNMK